jgi:hypothetical protein
MRKPVSRTLPGIGVRRRVSRMQKFGHEALAKVVGTPGDRLVNLPRPRIALASQGDCDAGFDSVRDREIDRNPCESSRCLFQQDA